MAQEVEYETREEERDEIQKIVAGLLIKHRLVVVMPTDDGENVNFLEPIEYLEAEPYSYAVH